jgi:hypothetical protein
MAQTDADRITEAVAHMRTATEIDAAVLRIRLAGDLEAIRTVDALERRIYTLTDGVATFKSAAVTILDAIARTEEHRQ